MFLLVFRNDVNTRPLQISVHVNNTNNFNFYGQQPTENDGNQKKLQGNMSQSSDEPVDDDDDDDDEEDDDDDTEQDTDENSVDEVNGPNFPTPPNTIASSQDDNNNDHD